MKGSLFNKYEEDFLDRTEKIFERINKLEEEIRNIDIENIFTFDSTELSIDKLKREITLYFQYNNGSLGFDIILIEYILRQLLIYIYITKEKDLTEKEKNTCSFEIEVRFYFFLNSIFNFKEKLEEFFNISENKGKTITFKPDTILSDNGKRCILKLFKESYKIIKDYCDARCCIVHDIYALRYDVLKNEINIVASKFNLSEKNISGRAKRKYSFILNDKTLANLVEEMQKIRKETIIILLDTKKNINIQKLTNKFINDDKGVYSF
jgi:hypothetical protein